jgi:hypothetical protein
MGINDGGLMLEEVDINNNLTGITRYATAEEVDKIGPQR